MENPDTSNPLLQFAGLPRFSAIKPEHVLPALTRILAENRAQREELLAPGRVCTWDDLVQPLEDMQERLGRMWSPVSHLNAVLNNEVLRLAYNDGLPKIADFSTELAQDERLYAAYKYIACSPGFGLLSAAQKRIVKNALRDFRLAGAELSAPNKTRYKEIQTQLSNLTSLFSENVLDVTKAWELVLTDPNDVAGLPESARAMAAESARSQGKSGWRFTLDAPSYLAFMSYADNQALRQKVYEAYVTRASEKGPHAERFDNGPLIVTILKLRREAARLLGFANYAEHALQTRMAKSVSEVRDFLYRLGERSQPAARRDYTELQEFARNRFGVNDLAAWDIGYFSEKLRAHRFDFSQEDLRPYFPENRVIEGMFEVVRRLYGLRISPLKNVEVWHPDVRFYEIRDEGDQVRGRFYMDLYARVNKRGGAWMDECVNRKRRDHEIQTPVAYLTCNFTPPVGGQPALFTHDEVNTLFHEFGHGLHHMLTQVDHVGVAGINGVAWDAVELPSQFMENWCWERQALDAISGHYQTGEPIPADLYEKMMAAKNFQSGMQFSRQLELALFDIRLHSDFDPEGTKTVQQLLDEVRNEVAVVMPPPFNRFQNSFTHIFAGGYAAGYYSYKWAEVLSADAFSKFEENGVFDRRTGQEFMHNILEQGGVQDPLELFVAFRGRPPRIDALLRHAGLAA